jgi:hypothetical protein
MARGRAAAAAPSAALAVAVLIALAAAASLPSAAAAAASDKCDLSLTFFPDGTTNTPASLTRAGQAALKPPNKDADQLLTVPIYGNTVPVVHVAPVSPLTTLGGCVPASCFPGKGGRRRRRGLLQSCSRTLAPAQYRVSYSFEGAPPAVAGPYSPTDPAPSITISEVAQMPPGTWCADVVVALVPETARVTQYSAGFLPAKDQFAKRTICFLKKAGVAPAGADAVEAEAEAEAEADAAAADAAPVEEEPAMPVAAADDTPAEPKLLPPQPKAGRGTADPKNLTAPAEAVDEAKQAQASRYFCAKFLNLAGKDAGKVAVPAGDEGTTACADACNSKGGGCQGFKVAGTSCALLGAIAPGAAKADAAVSAACVKKQDDWLAVAKPTAGAGFYCLANYDLAGDQAGAPTATSAEAGPPPPRPPGGLAKPEVATTSILLCAEQCRLFEGGCQFFVQQSGICYLKSNMIGGAYGTTGPSNTTLNTCIQGSEAWTLFGGQLDYLLPPPTADRLEVDSSLLLPGGGAAAPAGGGNATYYCIREYVVNGTLVRSGPVANAGTDDSVVACAAECDKLGLGCAAHITTAQGACGLYSGIKPRTTGKGDPTIQQLCMRSALDWDALGSGDPADGGGKEDSGRCLSKYDLAGDGLKEVPYLGNTGGTQVEAWCRAQCKQEPKCEFVVAAAGKCYLKNQMLVGAFGRTGYSEKAIKACVKSPSAWMNLANMVSAGGRGATGAFNGTGAAQLAARRAAAKKANGARGGIGRPGAMMACSAALLAVAMAAI